MSRVEMSGVVNIFDWRGKYFSFKSMDWDPLLIFSQATIELCRITCISQLSTKWKFPFWEMLWEICPISARSAITSGHQFLSHPICLPLQYLTSNGSFTMIPKIRGEAMMHWEQSIMPYSIYSPNHLMPDFSFSHCSTKSSFRSNFRFQGSIDSRHQTKLSP